MNANIKWSVFILGSFLSILSSIAKAELKEISLPSNGNAIIKADQSQKDHDIVASGWRCNFCYSPQQNEWWYCEEHKPGYECD